MSLRNKLKKILIKQKKTEKKYLFMIFNFLGGKQKQGIILMFTCFVRRPTTETTCTTSTDSQTNSEHNHQEVEANILGIFITTSNPFLNVHVIMSPMMHPTSNSSPNLTNLEKFAFFFNETIWSFVNFYSLKC